MNYISIVSAYAHQNKLKIYEDYKSNGIFQQFTIKIANDQIDFSSNLTKKIMRFNAYKSFYEKYKHLFIKIKIRKFYNYDSKPGMDYLQYSQDGILTKTKIHINNTEFFNQNHTLLSLDTEGTNPPCLVQLCEEQTNVYLFYLPQFINEIKNILNDPNVTKIVCDIKAEEKNFNQNITNYIDIQGTKRKSLVNCIKERFNVELKKDARIHFKGWKQPFTKDQIDYAAADAIWTLLLK